MTFRVALALICVAVAPEALAQREGDAAHFHNSADRLGMESSTRDVLPHSDRAEAERKMRDFAQCVVRGDRGTVQKILVAAPDSPEERAILFRIADGRKGCLGRGKLGMKGNWMRGALAEQLYLRSYPDPLSGAPQPDAPLPVAATKLQPYHAYADCVVARDAPGADAVLRAEPGSTEEKAAYRQAMPILSSCLAGGEDSKLAIDRTALRGYLAEALYNRRGSAG